MPERDADESPIDQRPPADEEPAAQRGDERMIPAEDEAAGHSCQPPRELPPDPGARWRCPECGRIWLLEDVSKSDEGGPGQRVSWKAAS
jgi:hypothetical protein